VLLVNGPIAANLALAYGTDAAIDAPPAGAARALPRARRDAGRRRLVKGRDSRLPVHNARYPASVYAKPAWDAGAVKLNADFPDIHYGSDARLPIVARPEDIQIIVCGGAGKHSHFWPGPKGIVSRRIAPWR